MARSKEIKTCLVCTNIDCAVRGSQAILSGIQEGLQAAGSDLDRATRFYETVLAAIGFAKIDVRPKTVGFGKSYSEFWLNHRPAMASV